jgi:3-isopropylmalate/(R)-2-methylmalate dehydratase small subunit
MNAPRYQGASILLARDNFGCGSSREHAPWALFDYGIRSIIAPSFADIFFNNCFNNGMLPIRLSADLVEELFQQTRAAEGYSLEINLPGQKIIRPDGSAISFEITPFLKQRLLNGWDQIGLTLRYEDAITAYEEKRAAARNA